MAMVSIRISFIAIFTMYFLIECTSIDLEVGKAIHNGSVVNGSNIYYKLSISNLKLKANDYLVFSIYEENNSDPDIYISKTIEKPSNKNFDFSCSAHGTDLCVIPSEVLNTNNLYISIECATQKCYYSLKAFVISENKLELDIPANSSAKKFDAILYKLFLPFNSEIESISFKLHRRAIYSSIIFYGISMNKNFIALGTFPEPQHTWEGYVFKFTRKSSWFCTNCSYYIIISSSEKPIEFTLVASTSEHNVFIKENSPPLADAVSYQEFNCYQYNVMHPSQNLKVRLNTYSGNPEIYVHPNEEKMPKEIYDFLFSSHGIRDEILVITSEQKARARKASGNYTICIYGAFAATYEIKIEEDDNEYKTLYDGFTYTSEIHQNELMIFNYKPDNLSADIKFSLKSVTGNVDLYVKYCEDSMQKNALEENSNICKLERSQLNNSEISSSKQIEEIDFILMENRNECSLDKSCYYLVGVFGVYENISSFSLEVNDYSKQFLALKEGEPTFDFVRHYQYKYYEFYNVDPNVTNIKFQLTTTSGDADIFASRNISFCSNLTAEKASNTNSFLPDIIEYDIAETNLSSRYYISVYGFTQAYFFIEVIITKEIENAIVYTMHNLDHGETMRYSLSHENKFALFSISLKNPSSKEIKINLSPESGHFALYAGIGFTPSITNYTMKTLDTIMILNTKDVLNSSQIILLVEQTDLEEMNSSFSISYSFHFNSIIIYDGIPLKSLINKNEYEYYKFTVTNLDQKIKVSLITFTGRTRVFVSFNKTNKFPNSTSFDIKSPISRNEAVLTIDTELLQSHFKNCSFNSKISNCEIYLGVTSRESDSLYSITISQMEGGLIMLNPEDMLFGSVVGNEIDYYYYQTSDPKDYSIMLFATNSEKCKIIMSIDELHGKNRSLNLPTKSSFQYTSDSFGADEIIKISKAKFNCTRCVLLIGIVAINSDLEREANYTISLTTSNSSLKTPLIEGETIVGFVPSREYTYYKYYVSCDYCSLTVSVYPISNCNPDLFINKNLSIVPTTLKFDFSSTKRFGEYFTIFNTDQFFIQRKETLKGFYTLGIYSETNCSYEITSSTSAGNKIELKLGSPLSVRQFSEYKIFFFENTLEEFKASLQVSGGAPILRAVSLNSYDEEKIISSIPTNENKSQWSTLKSPIPDSIFFSKSNPNFKIGTYIFAVQCIKHCQYSIFVQNMDEASFIFLKMGHPYVDHIYQNHKGKYQFALYTPHDINITFTIFSGKIKYFIGDTINVNATRNLKNGVAYRFASEYITFKEFVNLESRFYYIVIEAITDCEISLLVSESGETIRLIEGFPQTFGLHFENKTSTFLYDSSHEFIKESQSEEIKIGFSLRSLKSDFIPEIYILFLSPINSKTITFPNETFYNYKYEIANSSTREISAYYSHIKYSNCLMAITVKGRFLPSMDVINEGKFQITAFSGNPIFLREGIPVENTLSQINDYQIYEVSTMTLDSIVIKVTPCIGEVNYFITALDSKNNMIEVKGSKEITPSRIIKTTIEIPQGLYTINVKPVKLESLDSLSISKQATYSIEYYSKTDANKFEYIAGNNGKIDYTIEEKIITVKWERIEQIEKGSLNINKLYPEKILYLIYSTEKLDAKLDTPCGIKFAESRLVGNQNSNFDITQIRMELPYLNDFKLNVIAQIPSTNEIIIYESIIIVPRRIFFRPRIRYILIFSILFLALIGIIVILYRKLRKTQQILEYELKDIRNLASTVEAVEINKKEEGNYNKLIKEETQ